MRIRLRLGGVSRAGRLSLEHNQQQQKQQVPASGERGAVTSGQRFGNEASALVSGEDEGLLLEIVHSNTGGFCCLPRGWMLVLVFCAIATLVAVKAVG